jgi:hypothetical protein
MTTWQFYPKARPLPDHLDAVVAVFDAATVLIGSEAQKLTSNQVLSQVANPLTKLGYEVEMGAAKAQKVYVPVLFGRQGRVTKAFEVDGYSKEHRTVIEVEAGRAVVNHQFLKDLFEACVMPSVDYLVIAVRNDYLGQNDFEKVCTFLDALYASDRFRVPLAGVLVLGY